MADLQQSGTSTPNFASLSLNLIDGTKIPCLGMGTSKVYWTEIQANYYIGKALDNGYRHFNLDGNKPHIAEALKKQLKRYDIMRDEVTISSVVKMIPRKCSYRSYSSALDQIEADLDRLGMYYIDLMLVDISSKTNNDKLDTWWVAETIKDFGYTRSLGSYNFSVDDIHRLRYRNIKCLPTVNQIQFNPISGHRIMDVMDYCNALGIKTQATNLFASDLSGSLLNHFEIKHIAICRKVAPSQIVNPRTMSEQLKNVSAMNKLYIGNLPMEADEAAVRQLFAEHNLTVADISVKRGGYAFVDFPDQSAADRAIDKLHGYSYCGLPLIVEPSVANKKIMNAPNLQSASATQLKETSTDSSTAGGGGPGGWRVLWPRAARCQATRGASGGPHSHARRRPPHPLTSLGDRARFADCRQTAVSTSDRTASLRYHHSAAPVAGARFSRSLTRVPTNRTPRKWMVTRPRAPRATHPPPTRTGERFQPGVHIPREHSHETENYVIGDAIAALTLSGHGEVEVHNHHPALSCTRAPLVTPPVTEVIR
ncbi:unnamed protein product [Leptosia nina]|uniref:RRM domain-containing protein n=1 Tax=Leptosia nina TaxID=320188 RepID=A0AAV1K2N8_9NEOP